MLIDGIKRIKSPNYRPTISALKSIAYKKDIAIVLSCFLSRLFQNVGNKNTIVDRIKFLFYFDDLLLIHRESIDFYNVENSDKVEVFVPKTGSPIPIIAEYLCRKGYYYLPDS